MTHGIELVEVLLSMTSTIEVEVTVRRDGRQQVGSASGSEQLPTVIRATLDAVLRADERVRFGDVTSVTLDDHEVIVVLLHPAGTYRTGGIVGSAATFQLDVSAAAEATVDALEQVLVGPPTAAPEPHVDRGTIAAHQIRSPLTTVIGILQTLDRHADRLDAETSREFVVRALGQAQRLMDRVDGILGTGDRQDTQTAEVREAIRRAAEDAGAADVVEIDCPDDLFAACPQEHLVEIVGILVANAVEHGAPPVVARARRSDGQARIEITDHGAGLPPRREEAVFRGGVTTSEHGHGIGLAAARTFARSHHGDVAYEPDREVSRFVVQLPVAAVVRS